MARLSPRWTKPGRGLPPSHRGGPKLPLVNCVQAWRKDKNMEKRIGQVTHYFGRLGVAVLQLSDELKVGDVVHISGHTTDFTQPVESMEIEHQRVDAAGPGSDVALKVSQRVRGGDSIHKVIE